MVKDVGNKRLFQGFYLNKEWTACDSYLTRYLCVTLGIVLDTEDSAMSENHKWYITSASHAQCARCFC